MPLSLMEEFWGPDGCQAGDCIKWNAWGGLKHFAIVLWVGDDVVGLAHNTAPHDKRSKSEFMYEIYSKKEIWQKPGLEELRWKDVMVVLGIKLLEEALGMELLEEALAVDYGLHSRFIVQERPKVIARALFLLNYRPLSYHILFANCQSTAIWVLLKRFITPTGFGASLVTVILFSSLIPLAVFGVVIPLVEVGLSNAFAQNEDHWHEQARAWLEGSDEWKLRGGNIPQKQCQNAKGPPPSSSSSSSQSSWLFG